MKACLIKTIHKAIHALCLAMPAFFSISSNTNAALNCILPPVLSDPIVFDGICPGDANFPSDLNARGRDVYINLPKDRICTKHLSLAYPRNVRITGGQISFDDQASAVITVSFTSGTSFIDGLYIDVAGKLTDAMRVHHHTGRLIIQNAFVKGITGTPNGFHGDVLQTQGDGPLQELSLQNVTAMTGYQGLFTPYRPSSGDGTHKLWVNRINFSYDPKFRKSSGAGKPLMLLYLESSTDSYDRVPDRGTTLSNVYVDPSYWKDFPYTHAVYAKPVGGSVGCATFASANKINGQVCGGRPAEGDFAPANKVGLNYKWSNFCK